MAQLFVDTSLGQNKTPDNWQCLNRVGGSWTFGQAPSGCDASSFGEDSYVWNTYQPVVLDLKNVSVPEQSRYMDEMGAVLRESASTYLKKRKPSASAAEVIGFAHAIFALAHQETYWSHYRINSENRLKMMRGDSGHGHGLMQVDDRWHFVEINKGVGWNLMNNLVYGYELYFAAWESADKANCVVNNDDYRSKARAAYSVYNGGASKICRWTNSSDKWAANDKGFVDKYDTQKWKPLITDPEKRSQVNIDCLLDGQESCPLRSPAGNEDIPLENSVYQNSQNELCVFRTGSFHCISNTRDLACLQRWAGGVSDEITSMTPTMENKEKKELFDRHDLCLSKTDFEISEMGSVLKVGKNINLRATPAGNPLLMIPSGAILQVYDYEVRTQTEGNRYYQVQFNGQWGYFYAGNKLDHDQWASITTLKNKELLIANNGQKIKIINNTGINLRDSIGGKVLVNIPKSKLVTVIKAVTQSESNELYYQVTYLGKTGFIYAGRSIPDKTFNQWCSVVLN